jgi:hypothetical protein
MMNKQKSIAREKFINLALKGIQINMRDMTRVWNFANEWIDADNSISVYALNVYIRRYVDSLNQVR